MDLNFNLKNELYAFMFFFFYFHELLFLFLRLDTREFVPESWMSTVKSLAIVLTP